MCVLCTSMIVSGSVTCTSWCIHAFEKHSSDGVEREHSVSRLQRAPGIGAYGNHVSGHTVCSEPFPSCLDSNVSYPLRLQCAYNVSYPAPTMSHTLCAYSVQHSHTVAIHEICSLLLLARCKILFQLRYVWGLTLIRQVYTQEKLMNCSWLTGFRSRAQSRHHCRRRGRDVDWLHPAGLCLDGASGGYKFWAGQ